MNAINGDKSSTTSRELLESQVHIWNHMFGFINSMCLRCAVELNIPDTIHAHARPMSLSSLVQYLEINPTKATHLNRLMRILTHSGFFILTKIQKENQEEEEGYLLAPASRLLLKDEPTNLRSLILCLLDPIFIGTYFSLSKFFNNSEETVFQTTNNANIWEYLGNNEMLNNLFNDGMAKDSDLIGRVVVENCRRVFEGLSSVVDVGGGTGTLARTFAGAFPEIQWTVLDLPHVVNQLQSENNLHFVGGDMFESIPNANAILLKWVLHDWSDEDCIKILKNCKKAIPSKETGKVIIIDMVVDNGGLDKKSTESKLFFDITMMVYLTGKERNEKEWNKIFIGAGFNEYKITNIGSRSVIELYFSNE